MEYPYFKDIGSIIKIDEALNGPARRAVPRIELPNDPVTKPEHYTSGKIEVIDFIEDQQLEYHLGNAIKYIARAGKKDAGKKIEDIRKAIWYLNRYVELMLKP